MKQIRFLPLRQERERRGWSRNYIAEQIGVDVVTVGRWERGERMPHPQYRQKLCDLFELSAQELGLFSELSPEFDGTVSTDPSLESADAPMVDADTSQAQEQDVSSAATIHTSQKVEITSTDIVGTEHSQQINSTHKKPLEPLPLLLRHRRKFLIGLAGAGVLALVGSRFLPGAHTPSATTLALTPVPLSKRSHHFIDSNGANWVNHLAWSPDGKEVAVASGLNVIPVWNVAKEAVVLYYSTLNNWVNDVAWTKTNRIAATSADFNSGTLQVWQHPNVEPIFTAKRAYSLRSVSWSPDGQYLAFSGRTPTIEVWNPFTRQKVSQYSDPTLGSMGITRVKWSPSGKLLACAADDNTAHVWEPFTGKPKTIYRGHHNRVHDLDWSPDERYIVTASADKTSHVWDVSSGRTLYTYRGHSGIVEGVDWSPRGNYIATASSDLSAQVWAPFTGNLAATYGKYNSTVETVLWTMDGSSLAIGTDTGGFEIWPAPQ